MLKQASPRSILPGKESCVDTRGSSLSVPMRLTVTGGHDAQQVTHDWHDRVFAMGLARRSPSAACLS
jgi:hypothetical protein